MNIPRTPFTVEVMKEDDIEAAIRVLQQSWLDVYVNEDLGITRTWIEERNRVSSSPKNAEIRRNKFKDANTAGWVAKDKSGAIIGMTTPYYDDNGTQHVGSLYVDKNWHGKGVGGALMQKVIEWFDPAKPIELGVAVYNERAKAFYRKWGFEELPNSETLFANKIPEVRMIRKPSAIRTQE